METTIPKKENKKKVCFAASSGGHLEQLIMLRPLMEKYDGFVVTEKTLYDVKIGNQRVLYVRQVNRKDPLFLLHLLGNAFVSMKILLREKPDIVICTGVLAVVPLCLFAKLFGKKLIYIESFAKINSPTLTGKLMYHFADRFYVQWEPMLKVFPKAIFLGGIY